MNGPLHLTQRDRAIVAALVLRVRLLSQRQTADHWWNGDTANVRRRLSQLANHGLVQRITVQARTLPVLESPLISWRPGDPTPDLGSIAWQCQSRWRGRAVRPCTAWIATETAARQFGGVGRGELKHPAQATHDLGVAAVWLRLNEIAPQWAQAWRGEDVMAHTRRGEKLPDAFIVDGAQKVTGVIEFGGSYDALRVTEFHEDCVARSLPYQLW